MSKSGWGVLGLVAALSLGAGALEAQPATEVSDRVPQPAALKGEFYVGPHIGLTFFGHKDVFCRCDVDGNDFVFLGGRMGYMITNNLAVEATGQFTRPDRVPSYWEFTGGALWDFTPRNPGWNTYVAAGGGASRPRPYFRGKGVAIAYLAVGSEYRFNKLIGMRLEMKGQYSFRATLLRPVRVSYGCADNPCKESVQPTNALNAFRDHLRGEPPTKFDLVFGGDTHMFQFFVPRDRKIPAQVVAGMSGTLLEAKRAYPDAVLDHGYGIDLAGTAGDLWMHRGFGYLVLSKENGAWSAALHDPDGKRVLTCDLAAAALDRAQTDFPCRK